MSHKLDSDEIAKAWRDFYKYYLKHRSEVQQAIADKLFGDFVDYKNVPFGDKEIWHERKNG